MQIWFGHDASSRLPRVLRGVPGGPPLAGGLRRFGFLANRFSPSAGPSPSSHGRCRTAWAVIVRSIPGRVQPGRSHLSCGSIGFTLQVFHRRDVGSHAGVTVGPLAPEPYDASNGRLAGCHACVNCAFGSRCPAYSRSYLVYGYVP
jgi:hypothetical protein